MILLSGVMHLLPDCFNACQTCCNHPCRTWICSPRCCSACSAAAWSSLDQHCHLVAGLSPFLACRVMNKYSAVYLFLPVCCLPVYLGINIRTYPRILINHKYFSAFDSKEIHSDILLSLLGSLMWQFWAVLAVSVALFYCISSQHGQLMRKIQFMLLQVIRLTNRNWCETFEMWCHCVAFHAVTANWYS